MKKKNNIKNPVTDYIRYKQLNWYGHARRMKNATSKYKLEWCPLGRRRKGRPRNSWIQEVTTGMRKKGN